MKKTFLTALLLALVSILALPRPVQAQSADATVQGWFFWMEGCPHCEAVLQEVMPGITQRYASQIEITYVEIATMKDVDGLYQIAAAYGLSKEETGVPMVIINHQALVGSDVISAQLEDVIQAALEAGGASYDVLPVQPGHVSQQAPAIQPAQEGNKPNGFVLAEIVLAGMILTVLYEIYRFVVGLSEESAQKAWPTWQKNLIPVLAIIGLGVAFYLAFVETTHATAVCGPVGDCNSVQHSPYAILFGFLPVAVMGVAGYIVMLGAWLVAQWRHGQKIADWAYLTLYGAAFFGTVFSIYLTYLEPFVIRAVCMWCLSSAVVITLILLLSTRPALEALNKDLF